MTSPRSSRSASSTRFFPANPLSPVSELALLIEVLGEYWMWIRRVPPFAGLADRDCRDWRTRAIARNQFRAYFSVRSVRSISRCGVPMRPHRFCDPRDLQIPGRQEPLRRVPARESVALFWTSDGPGSIGLASCPPWSDARTLMVAPWPGELSWTPCTPASTNSLVPRGRGNPPPAPADRENDIVPCACLD